MLLYGTAIVLVAAAVWLAVVGDGAVFGVVVLGALAVAVVFQIREQRHLLARRRRRE